MFVAKCVKSVDYCLLVWTMCVSIDNREQDFRELCIYLLLIVLRDQQILVMQCKYSQTKIISDKNTSKRFHSTAEILLSFN